jgi:hypothetical protein
LDREDLDGDSLLWNAFTAPAEFTICCFLNMGADSSAVDSAGARSPRARAFEIGDLRVLEGLASLRYLAQIEITAGDLLLWANVSVLAGALACTVMPRGEGKRVLVVAPAVRRDELDLDEITECLYSVKSLLATDMPEGRGHAFRASDANCSGCRFRIRWTSDASSFQLQMDNLYLCCFCGRTRASPTLHPPFTQHSVRFPSNGALALP